MRVDENTNNWNLNMPVPNGTVIRHVRVTLDFVPRGWDPLKTDGLHTVFWLQKGTFPRPFRWADNIVGYFFIRGPGQNKRIIKCDLGVDHRITANYHMAMLHRYRLVYELDLTTHEAGYTMTRDDGQVVSTNFTIENSEIVVQNGGFFIQFGSMVTEEGPEAHTPDWSFYDFRGEFW